MLPTSKSQNEFLVASSSPFRRYHIVPPVLRQQLALARIQRRLMGLVDIMAGQSLILLLSASSMDSMERDTGCDLLGCPANLHANFLTVDITMNNYWLRGLLSTTGSTLNGDLTPPSCDTAMHPTTPYAGSTMPMLADRYSPRT